MHSDETCFRVRSLPLPDVILYEEQLFRTRCKPFRRIGENDG